jgi:hypothetical protein
VPDLALYRQIVDVLFAEHEKSTPPRPRDEAMARRLAVTWACTARCTASPAPPWCWPTTAWARKASCSTG